MSRSKSKVLVIALAALWMAGCGVGDQDARLVVERDLVAELPYAEVDSEVEVIDFGTEAAEIYLGAGWSWGETSKDGTTLSWATGESSTVEFIVTESRDLPISFRLQPFRGEQSQVVTLEINGEVVSDLELRGGWSRREAILPRAALRVGINRLDLHYRFSSRPRPGARRSLAVAWDWMRFGEAVRKDGSLGTQLSEERAAGAVARAARSGSSALLELSPGSLTRFYFDLPPRSVLSLDGLRFPNGSDSRLSISSRVAGGEETPLGRWQGTEEIAGRIDAALDDTGGLTRLTFAVTAGKEPSREPLRLEAPRVLAPEEETPVARSTAAAVVPARPNIIVYMVDTLRADRLSVYGYPRDTSPNVSRLAADGVVFSNSVAQAPWTLPSVTSLFTGLWPLAHGVIAREAKLPDELTTFAEVLHENGYRTAAAVANGWISEDRGFARGFDDFYLSQNQDGSALALQAHALDWIDGLSDESPFFLYVHTIEPHSPYDPPVLFRKEFAADVDDPDLGTNETLQELKKKRRLSTRGVIGDISALYDAEVAFMDYQLGLFLDALSDRGLYEESLILFLSDHGEEFFEHGSWTHGQSLHAEMIDVPMILKLPGAKSAGRRIATPVQHLDLPSTVIDAAGLEQPTSFQGESLLKLVSGDAFGDRPAVFSARAVHAVSAVGERWKAISRQLNPRGRRSELFDRENDPGELSSVTADHPVVAGYLTSLIAREMVERTTRPDAETIDMTPEAEKQLRALGYLN